MFADDIALYCYHVIRTRAELTTYICKKMFPFPPALGKSFFTSSLTSANSCSSQGRGLTPYLHPLWPWMEQCWAEFPVINTWVSQLALTCHGLLILQIAATRHVDLLDFSKGAFINIHTCSPSPLRLYKSFIRPHLDYASIVWNHHLKGEIETREMYKSLPFEFVWDSEYNELLRVANLPPLHKRQAQVSLCQPYKIIHNQPVLFSTPILPGRPGHITWDLTLATLPLPLAHFWMQLITSVCHHGVQQSQRYSYREVNDLILFVCFGFVLLTYDQRSKPSYLRLYCLQKQCQWFPLCYSSIIQDWNYEDIKLRHVFFFLSRVFCTDAERECMHDHSKLLCKKWLARRGMDTV